ncbi:CRISPR-associated endonuclease Cas2 [Candidatus Uhrbacteria bacterium RIFCSPHIGHO2_12_FULL_47_11]|nr:MAG: CRISPR-associated endonuclease Cas2 [Candidatus Uhrbacteria bacterium RIFCSPHIGHO2_01_FULL_47_11]OGL68666.1 MAG: CRISPR-associated endonuclease Cas2 [Candidatus Uhrbacteria bacterium RIFCSPHIGHO2_02_FULL_46_47]OGL76125.1 MAG: CRISPR-associated endonuclease Cas2 [Candidatus Uhrbacteria bacterium RIFCSPHIGHO2_12_FULL_47_11]
MRKKIQKKKSRQAELLRYGLRAGRIFLQDMASLTGYIAAAGHNYNLGWAEYEERQEQTRKYEERERLRELKARKWIETKKIGEKLMVRLTAKGWQQVLRDRMRCTKTMCKDGRCIIVVFDVPESERHVRDTLRWILAECGFSMLQKSVWFSNKDVMDDLCALLQGTKLNKWVRIVVGNQLKQVFLKNALLRLKARQTAHKTGKA